MTPYLEKFLKDEEENYEDYRRIEHTSNDCDHVDQMLNRYNTLLRMLRRVVEAILDHMVEVTEIMTIPSESPREIGKGIGRAVNKLQKALAEVEEMAKSRIMD